MLELRYTPWSLDLLPCFTSTFPGEFLFIVIMLLTANGYRAIMSVYQINVEGINDMSKTIKTETPKKSAKNINFMGLLSLCVALAELASTYVFATQDNKVLWVLAVVLGIDAAQRLARAFVRV